MTAGWAAVLGAGLLLVATWFAADPGPPMRACQSAARSCRRYVGRVARRGGGRHA